MNLLKLPANVGKSCVFFSVCRLT
uniref:Uncharacterized protein n=1 Tax=Arundo donax TaxID=35708 RepID=A0A0A9FTX8_ARUDO